MATVAPEYQSRIARGITPTATNWVSRAAPLDQAALTEQVLNQSRSQWIEFIEFLAAVFKEKVYENQNLTDLDLRLHRLTLNGLLCDGEQLALFHKIFGEQTKRVEEFQSRVNEIDAKNAELFKTLIAWHGPIEAQSDIPESFKQAMREVEAGTLEDDDDL